MSFSNNLNNEFQYAMTEFLQICHTSRAASQVVECLVENKSERYSVENRNTIVKNLAEDVETALGVTANLMFRMPGPIHDALQTLLDEYLNWVDCILYEPIPSKDVLVM